MTYTNEDVYAQISIKVSKHYSGNKPLATIKRQVVQIPPIKVIVLIDKNNIKLVSWNNTKSAILLLTLTKCQTMPHKYTPLMCFILWNILVIYSSPKIFPCPCQCCIWSIQSIHLHNTKNASMPSVFSSNDVSK